MQSCAPKLFVTRTILKKSDNQDGALYPYLKVFLGLVDLLVVDLLTVALLVIVLLMASGCNKDRKEFNWIEEDGYRWAMLDVDASSMPGFKRLLPNRTGVDFENVLSEAAFLSNRHYVNGSGVALGDVDGDGWTDIYFANLESGNKLYKNVGGWRFEDITEVAGVQAADRYSTGAVLSDIDGDADLDLIVTSMGGPNALFVNDGAGRFDEVPAPAGFDGEMGSTTTTLADIDGDGDLDMYVGNYKKISVKDLFPPPVRSFEATVYQEDGHYKMRPDFAPHFRLHIEGNRLARFEYAEPDLLYINDGAGNFVSAPFTDGRFLNEQDSVLTEVPEEWALVARFQDINGDGAPDLYLCNDFESPDRLWINRGDGTFQLADQLALRKTSGSSMSVGFSDIDRDGDVDFFVADMLYPMYSDRQVQLGMQTPLPAQIGDISNRPQIMQNMLMLNRGDGTFADIAKMSGLDASGWTWASSFLDVDLDGYEDLLLATGHYYNAMDSDIQMRMRNAPATDKWRELLLYFPPLDQPNMAFRNKGDMRFEQMPAGWGLGASADMAHGMALADLDNDGDLDVVMNKLKAVAGVYENVGSAARVAVRLKGRGKNTQGIGAKIRVYGGAVEMQEKEVISGGLYLSGSDPLYSFASGESEEGLSLEVVWRSGESTRIDQVQPNRIYEVYE